MATFAVAGSSVNGGAITVTIPAGSNHAALMAWWHEDAGGSAGNAPTVPGGATVLGTAVFTGTLGFRDFAAYAITGLSAGSATFTPPASGGSQGCILIVASDVDQTTPFRATADGVSGDDWAPATSPLLNIATDGDNDLGTLVLYNPTAELPDMAGASGSTLRTSNGPADYGGYIYALTAPREGATTDMEASYTGANGSSGLAVAFVATAGAAAFDIEADPGSYAVTGTDAALLLGRAVDADAGSYAITGTDAGLRKGYRIEAEAGSYALTGTDADLIFEQVSAFTIEAESGTYEVTGTDAFFELVRIADPGEYVITGQDAGLFVGRAVDADAGSYAITGQDASLLLGRAIDADAGSYAVSGTDVDLRRSYVLAADAGAYEVTGQDASLILQGDYEILAEGGSYALTGTDAELRVGRVFVCESGSYEVTGAEVTLLRSLILAADPGAYVITGSDVGLGNVRSIEADSGSYEITGTDAELSRTRRLVAGTGSYSVTGTAATLIYSGEVPGIYGQRITAGLGNTRTGAVGEER